MKPHSLVPLITVVSLAFALPLHAADAPEEGKKGLILPKSAVAAAYMLGRLSNKELIAAPRSEFVYVALLQRKGLERKYRVEALNGLAKTRNTDLLTELLKGVAELDKKGEASDPVLADLAGILVQAKPADLAAKRADLEGMVTTLQRPLSRQMAFAALITADGGLDALWKKSEGAPAQMADLLLSLPLVRDEKIRAAALPKLQPLLQKADPAEVRRAAITALAAVPGHDADIFNTLATMLKAGTERATVVASLQRIPKKSWPKDQAEPLVTSLIAWLKTVPVDKLTEPDAVGAYQFATDLVSLLPTDKALALGKTLRGVGVSVFTIRTIHEQMLYDKTLIVVEAGKSVEIILQNEDVMPHNLVVLAPGSLDEVGEVAEKMPPDPDAQGRLYVPDSPKVLHATKLIEAGQQAKLSFTAPTEPGEYIYVCTFPGHWRRMVGTLAVVKDVEAYLASHAATAQPTMTEWKLEELTPDLPKVAAGRNLEAGKKFFTQLACIQCHKLGKDGATYGPDLTEVLKRLKGDRSALLREILEPSKVVEERYRNYAFETSDGESVSGMILKEDATTVTVQSGPSDALIQTLKKSDIKSRALQASSLMPIGLLYSLSKENILDLLAYVEAGGDTKAAAHQHQH
jgi:putative heme-binding domain-containing protein